MTEIRLRQLKEGDAPLMLEWMHDPEIQKSFRKNMLGITLSQAEEFCEKAVLSEPPVNGVTNHFAIVNESDEYLGTISLKHINLDDMSAEYAISTRKKAHGTGAAGAATKLLLGKAFNEYGLNRIYLTVLSDNTHAIHFYEKCGFVREGCLREYFKLPTGYADCYVYSVIARDFIKN